MTQHQEAIQVHDEDAQANREAKDRAQVDSLRAELGSEGWTYEPGDVVRVANRRVDGRFVAYEVMTVAEDNGGPTVACRPFYYPDLKQPYHVSRTWLLAGREGQ